MGIFQIGIPLTHNLPLIKISEEVSSWSFWREFDKTMLKRCDRLLIITMDGWVQSKGVLAEITVAEELGIPIDKINP